VSRGHSYSYSQHFANIIEDGKDIAVAAIAAKAGEMQNDTAELKLSSNRQHPWHIAAAIRELVLDHDHRIELSGPNRHEPN